MRGTGLRPGLAARMAPLARLVAGDRQAARVVPSSGEAAWLTAATAAAMGVLAVFALSLALAADRLSQRWSSALEGSATIRISAPEGQSDAQIRTVLDLLATTPGIAEARALDDAEERRLLEPWFGADLPPDALAVPRLVAITEAGAGFDAEGLRQRLAAEAPGAVLDDHARWRRPLAEAASRLRLLGAACVLLIAGVTGAMITLGANASLAANAQVIGVLRLIGARDAYIVRAFTRRFTLRAFWGAAAGAAAGTAGVASLPAAGTAGGILAGLGPQGAGWLWPLALPPAAALIAFLATRRAAWRRLRTLT